MDQTSNTGTQALANLLAYHGKSVSPTSLAGGRPNKDISANVLKTMAEENDLIAKILHIKKKSLLKANFPLIAFTQENEAILILAINNEDVLIQNKWNGYPLRRRYLDFCEEWSGQVLVARPSTPDHAETQFGLSTIARQIFQYRFVSLLILIGALVTQTLGLASPLIFEAVIDKVLPNQTANTLLVLTIGLIGVAVFEFATNILKTYLTNHTASRVDLKLGIAVFKHLLGLPLSYFGARQTGVIVARLREIESVRSFLTGSSLTAVMDAVFTLVYIIAMSFYSQKLLLFVLFTIPLYAVTCITFGPAFRARVNTKFTAGAKNQSFLVEVVSGIETVKTLRNEYNLTRSWAENLDFFVNSSLRVNSISSIVNQTIQLISKFSTAGILYIGANQVMTAELSIGGLVAFNMLSQRLTAPVLRLSQLWQDFYQIKVSSDRIGDVMNSPLERPPGLHGLSLENLTPSIHFEQVEFKYKVDGPIILHGLTTKIAAGDVVGIVGSSGSGKSTIAKLVQGLYSPSSGSIKIDGNEVTTYDLPWLRDQIGIVSQENYLFTGTVAENIASFDRTIPMERIIRTSKLAGAHEFIIEMPDGYQTTIAERGASLSGGQRQRLALARTLLREPCILILDEATSALDYESEAAIQANMPLICAGRTVLIIAHRLSAVRHCKKIIVVEKGKVFEEGSHNALLQQRGRYFDLLNVQTSVVAA